MVDPNSQTQKIRRKRDFSQVVDPLNNPNPNMNTLSYNMGPSNQNSPSKYSNNQTLQPLQSKDQNQNAYKQYLENQHDSLEQDPQKQFNTINATNDLERTKSSKQKKN